MPSVSTSTLCLRFFCLFTPCPQTCTTSILAKASMPLIPRRCTALRAAFRPNNCDRPDTTLTALRLRLLSPYYPARIAKRCAFSVMATPAITFTAARFRFPQITHHFFAFTTFSVGSVTISFRAPCFIPVHSAARAECATRKPFSSKL